MYDIAICVPTYKRPYLLERLINSLIKNNLNNELIGSVYLVIVDNDIEKSAKKVVDDFILNKSHIFKSIEYSVCIAKGLSNVRNKLIAEVDKIECEYILHIDDDEIASENWIYEMTLVASKNGSDLVMGPSIPVFDQEPPSWIKIHFGHLSIPDEKEIDFLETNNYLIRKEFLVKNNLRFDERFNFIGAEDSYFGVSALKSGGKINWSSKGIVMEIVPIERSNISWLMKRNYRSATTFTYLIILEREFQKLFFKILVSFAYLILGLSTLIFVPFRFKYRYWGLIKLATSLGGFAALINVKYQEYKK